MTLNVADVTARIARSIHKARKECGLSQDELGDSMQPPQRRNEISAWENGRRRPSEEHLLQLADILGRDISWFYIDHNGEPVAA
jgi:transcriptional regulator with XRE-family HTH domain